MEEITLTEEGVRKLHLKLNPHKAGVPDLIPARILNTQVIRMSKSRRVLATGGKQRSFGLHMVCFEMVLYHNEPH